MRKVVRHTMVLVAVGAVCGLPMMACSSGTDGSSSSGGSGTGTSGSNVGSVVGGMVNSLKQQVVGDWNLTSLMGKDIAPVLQQPGVSSEPTMTIADDGNISGFAGVNRYFSSLDFSRLAAGDFSLSPAGATKMAGTPEANQLENDFFAALNKVTGLDSSKLGEGVLSLLGEGGQELLRFVR
jgi:heat shock protein HslJ